MTFEYRDDTLRSLADIDDAARGWLTVTGEQYEQCLRDVAEWEPRPCPPLAS